VPGRQLTSAGDDPNPAWMVAPLLDREPNPPQSCVISFVRLHEHGFNAPVSKFMRGLCHHYGVEVHNSAPQRHFACGLLHRRLRWILGHPGALGPMGPPLSQRAAHSRHGREEDAPSSSRQRPHALTTRHPQGVVPTVHHDVEQR
jgi:hypothetical protein